ncbi:MAG: hypothetical protein LQ342_002712 [Letrouitia transgressa]|nr:MAG: hypothetical protein LQ342_002712 [Letrouitia transgressa]
MATPALITGATGLLGRQLVKAFDKAGWKVVGTGFSRANPPSILKVDLEDEAAIDSVLDEAKPQLVVHCAANRFPDKCDADPDGTRALNIGATRRLAQAASRRSIFLIYISTDYVFSGRPGEAPYEVDATRHPSNLYGQTKLAGEKAVLEEYGSTGLGVVLRVPVLYGSAEKPKESAVNVLMDAVWKAQEQGARIHMDDWALRYPTNTEDVARVCVDIGSKYLAADAARVALPRVLQFSSEDRFTKFEMCQLFAEIMGLPLEGMLGDKQGSDPNASAQRPYDTHLSTRALRDLGINVWTQDFKDWWYVPVPLLSESNN